MSIVKITLNFGSVFPFFGLILGVRRKICSNFILAALGSARMEGSGGELCH